ncbi:MAG: hypothetical protein DKINENOH_04830 [bacterium]|nr:hypothetical protein [bacterium]
MDFNHLMLLIGTNPLPNYVAASYFLARDSGLKKITAVYTPETYAIALRLQRVLRQAWERVSFHLCGLPEAGNPAAIRHEIAQYLKNFRHDRLHLNYTGGTKSMAVQAYRTVFTETTPGTASFSYLDAHDFRLKSDEGVSLSGDLRTEIHLSFDDLLALHECRKLAPSSEVDWGPANAVITDFVRRGWVHDFIAWKNATIRQLFYDNEALRRPSRVRREELAEGQPFYTQAQRVIAAFPAEQAWHFDERGELKLPEAKKDFKAFAQGILYLDGRWLEYYVTALLQEKIAQEQPGWEVLHNWRLVKGEAEKDFEIDAMLLIGYQLCGISITTARKESDCKGKAFEILHRVQQMGGEEARALLVTVLAEDRLTGEELARKIERDLEVDTGGQQPLRILGVRELRPERLWERIREHFAAEPVR